MKSLIILVAATMLMISGVSLQSCFASNIQIEARFQQAEDILFELLIPNSMARTEPHTKKEVQNLLREFKELSATFTKYPESSVPFLAEKLNPSKTTKDDDSICALQLLFEIDTETSRKVIREAQNHPKETVSRLAKEMVTQRTDALWGFRSKEKK